MTARKVTTVCSTNVGRRVDISTAEIVLVSIAVTVGEENREIGEMTFFHFKRTVLSEQHTD